MGFINKLRALYRESRAAMLALMLTGGALVGGGVFFAGTQAQAAGQCVDYVYSRTGVANCVINIQKIINASGVTSSLQTDGVYGPLTKSAVIAFQKNRGIMADGVVGKKTWAKLCAVTQAAAAAPKANAGCNTMTTSASTDKWTKIAWGGVTNGSKTADIEIYACKLPVKKSTERFQVRSKTVVVSSTGRPTFNAFLNVRQQDAAMTVATSANNDKTRKFTGKSLQLTTSSSSRSTPGYATATDVVRAQAEVLNGSGAVIAASTFTNYGSALSRPVMVSQLTNC